MLIPLVFWFVGARPRTICDNWLHFLAVRKSLLRIAKCLHIRLPCFRLKLPVVRLHLIVCGSRVIWHHTEDIVRAMAIEHGRVVPSILLRALSVVTARPHLWVLTHFSFHLKVLALTRSAKELAHLLSGQFVSRVVRYFVHTGTPSVQILFLQQDVSVFFLFVLVLMHLI
jgi:hypothetical protein